MKQKQGKLLSQYFASRGNFTVRRCITHIFNVNVIRDGKDGVSEGIPMPTKKSVYGRSSIYGALEAALEDELQCKL